VASGKRGLGETQNQASPSRADGLELAALAWPEAPEASKWGMGLY
jgi:hypothetical protein